MPRATIQKVMCGAILRPSLKGTRPGLTVSKVEDAVFGAGRAAAPAGEVGIGRTAHFRRAVVEAGAVGLPDFDDRIAHQRAGAVEDAAGDGDALAERLVVDHRGAEVVVVDATDAAEIRRQADMDVGTCRLRRAFP